MRLGRVVVVALALSGCATAGERTGSEEGVAADLAATMEVKVTEASVRLVLHVTNPGEEPVQLTFATSQRYDFVVETRSGAEVWRWSEGKAFAQALSEATLGPGESWSMDAVWDADGRTGEFIATGQLAAMDVDLTQRLVFELE